MTKVRIETARGSTAKFDYNPATGDFELKKVMPLGMAFPFDFGFIPGTLGGDGDPLDVLVCSEIPVFTGCVMSCRIIGCLTAEQKEKGKKAVRNDRFIAIPDESAMYKDIQELSGLPKNMLEELEHFFIGYNALAGKTFKLLQRLGAARAQKMIEAAKQERTPPTQLIQLLLPLRGQGHKPFPERYFTAVKEELTRRFGGVTVYERSPVSGLWQDDQQKIVSDTMLIFEVMTGAIDTAYWESYKTSLMKTFRQKELVIRRSAIGLL